MSRIGKQPIEIPTGVTVEIKGQQISVKGPAGNLQMEVLPGLKLVQEGSLLRIVPARQDPQTARTHGLARTLIANLLAGAAKPFERQLEINGVGYRATVSGQTVSLALGLSHPITYNLPKGIAAKVEKNILTISGADKQLVGQVAADIRALKKPEPYKGKGIKYVEEHIRRKAGKAATKAA